MDEPNLLKYLLDSFKEPVMFMDAQHIVRYFNKAAAERYKIRTTYLNRSIFKCHNEHSNQMIRDAFKCLTEGQEETMLMEDGRYYIFLRAVRNEAGTLLGYYARFEPKRTDDPSLSL